MPTITFSGLVSGLDTASWVDALVSVKQLTVTSLQNQMETLQTKQSHVSSLQTSFVSLRSSIEKITDSKFGSALDIFLNNSATSSDEDIFTATATKDATRQSYTIKVDQLATTTSASADRPVGAIADDSTELSSLGITEGSFSIYVDGVKTNIYIASDDTVGNLKETLESAGVTADIDKNGVLSLNSTDSNKKLLIGATNDTSNIKSIIGLTRQDDGTYKSTVSMYKATTASKVTESNLFSTGRVDSEGNPINTTVTEGTFKIGDATFTINSNTTIQSLVSEINASDEAGVTAFWDTTNSKLVLNSKVEGQSYINIEAGTSNFTDVMGLTSSVWNDDGTVATTALNTEVQDLGDNAILYINGTKVTSTSNTVTSDLSRLSGVTLNLKSVSTEEKQTSTLKVEQDTTAVVDAVKDFVEKYNSVMDSLDELTASDGDLFGDTAMNSIKTSIRQLATSGTKKSGDAYSLLAQVGISTAAVGAGLSDDTNTLSVDEEKLKQALSENPDAVKKVLMGTSDDQYGILSQMENIVENALSGNGYFETLNSTISSKITKYEDKISTQTTRIANYKSNLEAKFQAMEDTISKMQSSYSDYISSSS